MGIFKRENGYYYLRISTPSGEKRLSLETKDKAFAQDIYQAYLLDRIKKKLIPELIPDPVSAPAENSYPLNPHNPKKHPSPFVLPNTCNIAKPSM